jgi:hypothetical protein
LRDKKNYVKKVDQDGKQNTYHLFSFLTQIPRNRSEKTYPAVLTLTVPAAERIERLVEKK